MAVGTSFESTRARAALGSLWIAAQDLRFRSRRFVVAVGAASVTLMLLLLMTGVVNQLDREPGLTTKALNAEYWIMRTGVASPFTSSAAAFDQELASELVVDGPVNPILTGTLPFELPGSGPADAVLVAHQSEGPGVPIPAEGVLGTEDGGVAVSTEIPVDIGDRISLAGFEVEVTGKVKNTTLFSGMPMIFVAKDALERVTDTGTQVSALLTNTPPSFVPDGLVVRERAEVSVAAGKPTEKPVLSIHIVRILLAVVAAMIVGAVVYLASIERTRDVAVLRAVGTEGGMLAGGVAAQALAVAAVSALVANVLAVIVAPVFPITVHLTTVDLIFQPVAAGIVAVASSYVAIRRTLRIDPSIAFSGA